MKPAKILPGSHRDNSAAKPTLPQENPFKTLQLLIQPLKEFILSESAAGSDMETELRKLDEIWKWLLDNNPAPRIHEERR